ncbi:MAG: hypothetical protein ACYTFK_09290, partial [Planctomycetota bacterium]
MVQTRKMLVWLGTFILVVAAYLLYNRLVDTPDISIRSDSQKVDEIDVPDLDSSAAQIGGTTVGTVEVAKYIVVDEESKDVKLVYGFTELLNPDEGTQKWKLREPYMNIYGQDVRYEIVSDRGTVQVETIAGTPSPTDAHLMENVKIFILPTAPDGPSKTTIYLDDLVYDSERSEFTTAGPVKVVSDEGLMEGKGLMLIYNDTLGRVEYLRIYKLDYLHIKNASAMSSSSSSGSSEALSGEVAEARPAGSLTKPPAVSTSVVKSKNAKSPADADTAASDGDYYECQFERDVVITYGNRIIIEGAQDVTISNILFADKPADEISGDKKEVVSGSSPASPKLSSKVADITEGKPGKTVDESVQTETLARSTDDTEPESVFVRCKGPLTIKPMASVLSTTDETSSLNKTRMIEMRGKSIHVSQKVSPQKYYLATIARCGMIKYD